MKISDILNVPTLDVEELAKKYQVSTAKVQQQLDRGIQVELEHTQHKQVARRIALAHLGERLDYYQQLAKFDEDTTRTTAKGAPGTLKAKITRLYGGDVTCAKAERLKRRSGATAHDKAQANWFLNMNCGGASKLEEVFTEPGVEMPWTSYGSGESQYWETRFKFDNHDVSVEMHPDVRQVGAKYVFRNQSVNLPPHHVGWLTLFKVDDSTDLTGKLGNKAISLMVKVVQIMRGFLEKLDWDYVMFTGEEGSRDRLYQVLAKKLADQIGAHMLQYRSDFVIYKHALQEQGGVGLVVPGVNMPAGMHPDEIRRQARKFGFKVNTQGVPPIARTDGKY